MISVGGKGIINNPGAKHPTKFFMAATAPRALGAHVDTLLTCVLLPRTPLLVDDVITGVGGAAVTTADDLDRLLTREGTATFRVTVQRGRDTMIFEIQGQDPETCR